MWCWSGLNSPSSRVWRKGNINKNCLCVTVLCTIIMVHKDTSSSYRSVDCIGLWFCFLFSKRLCVFGLNGAIQILFFCLHPSLYLLVSWAWRDWPLTWLTNHCPSVLWHCWLGHVTRKIVSEMTYNVSSVKLYYTYTKSEFRTRRKSERKTDSNSEMIQCQSRHMSYA